MSSSFRGHLSSALSIDPALHNPEKAGGLFSRTFREVFPRDYMLKGTLLFGFLPDSEGKLIPCPGAGLAMNRSRMIGDMLMSFRDPTNAQKSYGARLESRFRGIFGPFLKFDFLATERRGKATPVIFLGQTCWVVWENLPFRAADGTIRKGGFLLAVPFEPRIEYRSSRLLLTRGARTKANLLPVILPMAGTVSSSSSAIFPDIGELSEAKRSLLRRFRGILAPPGIDLNAVSPGIASEISPGILAFRESVSIGKPHEMWILGNPPDQTSPPFSPFQVLFGGVIGFLWAGYFVRWGISGNPPEMSMKTRVIGLFLAVVTIPLSAFSLYGFRAIEVFRSGEIENLIERTIQEFRRIDSAGGSLQTRIGDLTKRALRDPEIREHVLDPDPVVQKRIVMSLKKWFESEEIPIPLQCIYLHPFKGVSRGYLSDGELVPRGQALGFHLTRTISERVWRFLLPEAQMPDPSANQDFQSRMLQTFFSNTYKDGGDASGFWVNRQKMQILELSRVRSHQIFDFLSRSGKPEGAVSLQFGVSNIAEKYLKIALIRAKLAGNLGGDTFLVDGNRGFKRSLLTTSRNRWFSPVGRRLRGLLETAVRNGSQEGIVETFPPGPGSGAPEEAVLVAVPSAQFPKWGMGAVISTREILEQSRIMEENLRLIIGFLILLTLGAGAWISRSLLIPLGFLERMVVRFSCGETELRVSLDRNDELGELGNALDEMFRGINERKHLGRFVSRTLDAEVTSATGVAQLSNSRRQGTVLVSDLRNFTMISERESPQRVVSLLNDHHKTMSEIIQAAGGRVEKFIGDAIVAVFFPESNPDPDQIIETAIQMRRAHEDLQKSRREAGLFTYEIGIGIAKGEILAGSFGRGDRREFTILGKPRTSAESLEAISKKGKHTRIIVHPDLALEVMHSRFEKIPGQAAFEVVGGGKA